MNPGNWQSPPAALQDDKTIKTRVKVGIIIGSVSNLPSQISRNYHHRRIRSNQNARGELGWLWRRIFSPSPTPFPVNHTRADFASFSKQRFINVVQYGLGVQSRHVERSPCHDLLHSDSEWRETVKDKSHDVASASAERTIVISNARLLLGHTAAWGNTCTRRTVPSTTQ